MRLRKSAKMTKSTTTIAAAMPLLVIVLIAIQLHNPTVMGQSNYASHANNVEYQGEGLPEEATLDGKVCIHI